MYSQILVINVGSSTLKCTRFAVKNQKDLSIDSEPVWQGLVEKKGSRFQFTEGILNEQKVHSLASSSLLKALKEIEPFLKVPEIIAVGHRVVHGGEKFTKPTILTPASISQIAKFSNIAPLHNPLNVEGIKIAKKMFQKIPQIAIFDTTFHCNMSKTSYVYPGPIEWLDQGIRRFGFHGISHHYCMEKVADILGKDIKALKLITCHLGNGCSLAAITNGKSQDTTMGFTPMEGLMMGTRSGSVDPGILFFLHRKKKLSFTALERTLNEDSGLKGIGKDSDMREILKKAPTDPYAKLALDLFIHSLIKNIAAMAASIGGVDLLSFSGGIGENAEEVRKRTCEALSFLGMGIDPKKNRQGTLDSVISKKNSSVAVFLIKAREDWMIAKETLKTLNEYQTK